MQALAEPQDFNPQNLFLQLYPATLDDSTRSIAVVTRATVTRRIHSGASNSAQV
jgi:hypothetical protein